MKTSEDLKQAGSKHYAAGEFDKALECYTNAIKIEPKNSIFYSNRAATYLALGQADLALADAEAGLNLDAKSAKLMFRKAKALFELQKYTKCQEFIAQSFRGAESFPEIDELRSKCLKILSFDRRNLIQSYLNAKRLHQSSHGSAVEALANMLTKGSDQSAPNESLPNAELVPEHCISMRDLIEKGHNFIHEGKFLLCRTIFDAYDLMGGCSMLVEDPDGIHLARLTLIGPEKIEGSENGQISAGTVLVLMNPWLNIPAAQGGGLRCNNAKQLVILPPDHKLLVNVEWRQSLPVEADEMKHTEDLELDAWKIHLECATRYFRRGRILMALDHAEKGLSLQPQNVNFVNVKANCLLELKRYQDCIAFLKLQLKTHPTIVQFQTLLKQCELFHAESSKGIYPLAEMYDVAMQEPRLDHADHFRSDFVEIRREEGKRPCLVAKQNIVSGTLLLAEKAVAFVFPGLPIEIDPELYTKYAQEKQRLLPILVKKLSEYPEIGRELYQLYAGPNLGSSGEEFNEDAPIDPAHLREIIRCNQVFTGLEDNDETSSALWLKSSNISHSCVDSNCYRQVIGDFSFIRAVKEIPAGHTLLLPLYCAPYESFAERSKVLQSRGAVCQCRLCDLQSKDSEELKEMVAKIRQEADEIGPQLFEGAAAEKIELVRKLADKALALPIDPALNILAAKIASKLAPLYFRENQFEKAIEAVKDYFDFFVNVGQYVDAHEQAYTMEQCYKELGDLVKAEEWRKKSDWLGRLMLGDPKLLPKFIEAQLRDV